ncbi:MAG: CAP domain-containing protein [Bacteroidia bacterium]
MAGLVLLAFSAMAQHAAPERSNAEKISAHLHRVVNQYRASIRLVELRRKSVLDQIAQEHADNVASGRVPFSHEGFSDRVAAIKPYAKWPYRAAENLYGIQISPPKVATMALDGWIDSPGHHVNLKGKFLYTGIGVAVSSEGEWIVCQIYVGKNE